jgi:hypothetical protein
MATIYSTLLFSGEPPSPDPDVIGTPGEGTLWVIRTVIMMPPQDDVGANPLGIGVFLGDGGAFIAQYRPPEIVTNVDKTVNFRVVVPFGVEVYAGAAELGWGLTLSGYVLTGP